MKRFAMFAGALAPAVLAAVGGAGAAYAANPAIKVGSVVLRSNATGDYLGQDTVHPLTTQNVQHSTAFYYVPPTNGIVNNTAVTVKAAAGAGVKIYITALQLKNVHATVATEVEVRCGAAGTVMWRGYAPAVMITGEAIRFPDPLACTANTLVEIAAITTGTKTYVDVQGYTGP